LTDQEYLLVQRAGEGDLDAFASLVGKYSNAVYGTAYGIIGDFHYAQDIAQEVFVKAWHKLGMLEDRSRFAGWLFTIAKRASLDWLNKEESKPVAAIDERMASESPSPEKLAEISERRHAVWLALHKLDEKHRDVVILYYMSGLNAREIGQYFGLSTAAVESRLRRSKQLLKKELSDMIEEALVSSKLDEQFEQKVLRELQGIVVAYIPALNLEKSAAWYERYLGYQVTHRGDIYSLERMGYLKVILIEVGSTSHPVQFSQGGSSNTALMIGAPHIEEYHAFLKLKGVQVEDIIDRGVCGKSFQMKDPAGNRIVVDG